MQDELAADIRIIELPLGRDPDDLIRLDPALEHFGQRRALGTSIIDFARREAIMTCKTHARAALSWRSSFRWFKPLGNRLFGRNIWIALRCSYACRCVGVTTQSPQRDARRPYAVAVASIATDKKRPAETRAPSRRSAYGVSVETRDDSSRRSSRRFRPTQVPCWTMAWRVNCCPLVSPEKLRHRVTAIPGLTELEPRLLGYVEQLTHEAAILPPFSTPEARLAVRQTLERLRERRLREAARSQHQDIAEHERTLGVRQVEDAVQTIGSGTLTNPADQRCC